jgi:hypothetical protein
MSGNLSFQNYQEEIRTLVETCSDEKLDLFCREIVSRILPFVHEADTSDLYETEINFLEILQQEVEKYPIEWKIVNKCLDKLTEINEDDEDHGMNIDHSIVEFLCALDNWRLFNDTRNKVAVCGVSENFMNVLDYNFTSEVSLERWLIVPEINAEYNKQIFFLRGGKS